MQFSVLFKFRMERELLLEIIDSLSEFHNPNFIRRASGKSEVTREQRKLGFLANIYRKFYGGTEIYQILHNFAVETRENQYPAPIAHFRSEAFMREFSTIHNELSRSFVNFPVTNGKYEIKLYHEAHFLKMELLTEIPITTETSIYAPLSNSARKLIKETLSFAINLGKLIMWPLIEKRISYTIEANPEKTLLYLDIIIKDPSPKAFLEPENVKTKKDE